MKFAAGDRIKISKKYNWAKGAFGTISLPPEFAQKLVVDEAPWQGLYREVIGRKTTIVFYWVWFDEPQVDEDGDGPYRGAEIEEKAIIKIRDSREEHIHTMNL